MVGFAYAADIGNTLPPKSDSHIMDNPASDGREGGETIATAVLIPGLPYSDTGATYDNIDDYDAVCPYPGSISPDVVYRYDAPASTNICLDLCGSDYDTKLYVLDAALNVLACNDDFYVGEPCGLYVSRIENLFVPAGQTIYIVVDGYGGDCGNYVFNTCNPPPCCNLVCWSDDHQDENEPPLVDEYVDEWNGGCNSAPPIFQWLECERFCGVAGWYLYTGLNYRDTDWFKCIAATNTITWTVDAESATICFELVVPPDCAATVTQSMTVGPCLPGTMTIPSSPGTIVDLWVGSVDFSNPGSVPGNEYDYIWEITGTEVVSATVNETWSGVKALFN